MYSKKHLLKLLELAKREEYDVPCGMAASSLIAGSGALLPACLDLALCTKLLGGGRQSGLSKTK